MALFESFKLRLLFKLGRHASGRSWDRGRRLAVDDEGGGALDAGEGFRGDTGEDVDLARQQRVDARLRVLQSPRGLRHLRADLDGVGADLSN